MVNDSLYDGMVQLHTNETVKSLKGNAVFPYPLYLVSSNFTYDFCRYLTGHGYTSAELLSVSTADADLNKQKKTLDGSPDTRLPFAALSNARPANVEKDTRKIETKVLYYSIQGIIQPLHECVQP